MRSISYKVIDPGSTLRSNIRWACVRWARLHDVHRRLRAFEPTQSELVQLGLQLHHRLQFTRKHCMTCHRSSNDVLCILACVRACKNGLPGRCIHRCHHRPWPRRRWFDALVQKVASTFSNSRYKFEAHMDNIMDVYCGVTTLSS